MARRKVRLDAGGMAAMIAEVGPKATGPVADQAAARARAGAPVQSGEYQASIVVTEGMSSAPFKRDRRPRPVHRVEATAPHALIVEFGTGNLVRALGGRS